MNEYKVVNLNLKILLVMGGWIVGSLIYLNMVFIVVNCKEFIDFVIDWLWKYNFDGFDMDWEYLVNRDGKFYDKENFVYFCKVI